MAITFKKKYKDEVTGEWSCPVCEVKMDSQHAFTVHIRQHNPTDHSHTCSICAKQLSSASSLDRHMLIHSGERPFKCRICNMAFTTNGNMHRHMRTHGQEQQQAVGYISSTTIDEEGMRVRNKKKRKPKSLPNSSPVNTQSNNSSFGFDDLSIKDSFLALLQLQNRAYNSFGNEFNFDLQRKDTDFDNSAYFLQNKSLNQLNLTNEKFLEIKDSKTSTEDFDESEHRSTTSSEEQQEMSLSEKNGNQNSDDEENKLDLKRSLSQNSTLYNTLFKCNNLTAAAVANGVNSTNSKSDLADISSILSVISNVTPMLANATADLQHLPLNEEQVAKITQFRQQALQNQNALLNSTTKSSSKRSKNGDYSRSQSIGNSRSLNTSINGKRIKRDIKDNNSSIDNSFNLDNSDQLKNISLEDDKSDQSIKNGSDIENEMTNGDRKFKNKTKLSSSSQQHQQMINNENTIEDDEEEEDEDTKNLSEEEEANKMEQELCEQEQQEFLLNTNKNSSLVKKCEDKPESISDENESLKKKSETLDNKNKKNESLLKSNEKDISSDSLKNSLASLITPKRSTTENLADLLIKSDKNNNKNMRNNNGTNDNSLNQRFFIDPMVEDDVKLLERQLQDQQYLCKICHLEVRSVNTLRRHQRLHDAGGQLYACHYCTYTSLDKSSLIRHLRTHNGERPYQCTICKYAFTTKANCERHVRKRHKKQNKNDIRVSMQYKVGNGNSDALISLNGSLQASNNSDQILDNIPPSSLVETNKSLLASSNMHLIPHVYYEPNSIETSCRYCHVDFRFNRLLRQHLRTMCNNNFTKKPFNCSLCNQGFTTKNVCIRHFEKNHKEVPHDQISNMIIEYNSEEPRINSNRFMNGNLSASILNSATGVFNPNNSGSDSGHLSNGDSNEIDQPLNLANGLYNGMKKFNNFSNDRYMDNDDDQYDQDNQNALDLSVRSNEKSSLDHLNTINRSLDLSLPNINNSLPEPSAELIRNALSSLLALQSFVPKSLSETNQQLVAQASNLLAGQNLNNNTMNSFLAAQTNQASGSLLNLFNTFM